MKYALAFFFVLFALVPLVRLLSGLRSSVVDLKVYLPLAKRSERPALYWAFICGNLLAFALLVMAGVFVLWRMT